MNETTLDLKASTFREEILRNSLAHETLRVYEAVLKVLNDWLDGRKLTDLLLAEHLHNLHRSKLSISRCVLCVSAVNFYARLHGLPSSAGEHAKHTLTMIRRSSTTSRAQTKGVRHEEVRILVQKIACENTVRGLRDAAMLACASDALLRVSEIKRIKVSDVSYKQDGTGTLTITRSKTDQLGEGKVLFLGQPTVGLIQRYIERSRVKNGYLFRWVNKGDNIAGSSLSEVSIRTVFKKRLIQKEENGRISGHSLRIGTAQSLAASGASLVAMMEAGRWKSSTMPAYYVRGELAERSAVALLLYGHKK